MAKNSSILIENENIASDLIEFWGNDENVKPKLIIFDLDFTLWPYFANHYYQTPFKLNKDSIIDSKNKRVTYFNDVPKILKTLKENCFKNDEKLAVASRSGDRKSVEALLELSYCYFF